MFKLVHIHSDPKFLRSINKYQHELFDNTMVFIGNGDSLDVEFPQNTVFFERTDENIDKITAYISVFDLVVFEDLTLFNKKILLKLPKGVKVSWRFFGHELYNKRLDLMLSQTSIEAANNEYKIYTKRGSVKDYYIFLKRKYSVIYDLYKYCKKIDHILLICEEEYKFLKKYWCFIPPFVQVPIAQFNNYEVKQKQNFFILGHSRNISNNHLDILNIINKSKNNLPYLAKMFLSYGSQNNYYNKVVEMIEGNSNIEMITDFLPREQFAETYSQASALVINSYRQIGLANILMAIRNNCKVYLNKKNPIKKWLEREGLKVFSIEDFVIDYEINNLKLSEENAKHNITMLNKMREKYGLEHFHKKILEIVKR